MIVRNGWSLIALTPSLKPGLPGPALHARSRGRPGRVTTRGGCQR